MKKYYRNQKGRFISDLQRAKNEQAKQWIIAFLMAYLAVCAVIA